MRLRLEQIMEMCSYIERHVELLSLWEKRFITNMKYWLEIRRIEPDEIQQMIIMQIYNRIKFTAEESN